MESRGRLLRLAAGRSPRKSPNKSGLSRDQVEILRNCASEKAIGELMSLIGRSNRTKFRDQVLRTLLDAGFIEMTIPDKPREAASKGIG